MYLKSFKLLLCLVALTACQSNSIEQSISQKALPVEFGQLNAEVPRKYAACHAPKKCGDLVAIDCDADVDGELVYINNSTGKIVMYCGGACEPGNRKPFGKECSMCPPKEWKCSLEH